MRDFADNIGGIRAAWIGLKSLAGTWPQLSDATASITLAQLGNLDPLEIFPYRALYTQSSQPSDQGTTYTKTASTAILTDNEATQTFIHTYDGQEIFLIIQDMDGRYWLMFDQENPGLFLEEFSSGENPTDGKSHGIRISGISQYPRKRLILTE
ncbi:hypothetical protein PBT90_00015 [Algoriphagus halophytocola]|uniref:hypothetical protein n=1 Tax=Algoriphagus halophytocola TaxID=2991499 RepID=UPI0022DD86D6|nr:hypothetical protein [Algoriphagus sp. TR-M9]WBL42371.1 hypothetical protein PBT90_16670 [Algoriphagus sp. TR-M9]WBL43092.1 hypothetical protein PBT90_00015 [Algoriphagus sp. TR-M9]